MIEIQHYFMNGKAVPIGLEMAWAVSKEVYKFYRDNMDEIAKAIKEKQISKTFELAVFYAIAVTGIISGLSKNSSQTALAHALYYNARTSFCKEARSYLHGEIVGVGLVVQLAYNGLDYATEIKKLKSMNLPASLSDIGIEPNNENIHTVVNWLYEGVKTEGDAEEVKQKLENAVKTICK